MENKLNISKKFIIVLAVVLAAVIGICAFLNRDAGNDAGSGTGITITADGESRAQYSMKEIMAMNSVTEHADLKSGSKADEKGDFTGVLLDELLKGTGINRCKTIVLTAGDGYSAAASFEEAENVLIAWYKDGETLGYFDKGGTGPLRAVFFKDTYGNRSIKNITKIDCRK